jgi:plastocyanin
MSSHQPLRGPRLTGIATVLLALVVILATALVVTACGGSTTSSTTAGTPATTSGASTTATSGAAGGGGQVAIKGFAFSPTSLTIKAGESVTWTNQDSAGHTVVADNGEFKSGDVAQGATYTFKFDKAGTYPYHCGIHPTMTGTIVVQ